MSFIPFGPSSSSCERSELSGTDKRITNRKFKVLGIQRLAYSVSRFSATDTDDEWSQDALLEFAFHSVGGGP